MERKDFMKRWIKNVLMISIIVLLSVGLAYTGVYAKKHVHASNSTITTNKGDTL